LRNIGLEGQKNVNQAILAANTGFLREITLYRTPQCKGGSQWKALWTRPYSKHYSFSQALYIGVIRGWNTR